jgi:EAL domain-containing protein (putative c-di-GMP-specific phosphodiesterase class I)
MWSIEEVLGSAATLPAEGDPTPQPATFFCSVTPLFQPIVHMGTGQILGYEALSRGPHGTPLFAARTLFATARTMGELPALERVCWTVAVLAARRAGLWNQDGARLFLNLSPERLLERGFVDFARRLMDDAGIDPHRIVVEVTEDSVARDHGTFLRSAESLRALGFGIAVDDLGVGYADLCAVAELRPDFLKVDQRLVRGVHSHVGRLHVLTALAALGRATGATVIAEGVEVAEELDAVRSLGIDYVQGFYLAEPSAGLDWMRSA